MPLFVTNAGLKTEFLPCRPCLCHWHVIQECTDCWGYSDTGLAEVLKWGACRVLWGDERWCRSLLVPLEGQCCPGEASAAGGRMEMKEGNKWNINIDMLPVQASSRFHLHKWSVEGKCLWNTFPFFRSFLWCRSRITLYFWSLFLLFIYCLSLPRLPPKDHSLTVPRSEIGLELFLCQRIVYCLVFHLSICLGDLKSNILEWKLCAWQGKSPLIAHGSLKALLQCWINLRWKQTCSSLAQ